MLDVAAVTATALLSDRHHGKIYTVSGPEALTKTEQVAAIGQAIGREIRFEELTPEQWREHVKQEMPPFVIDWLLGLWYGPWTTPSRCCRPSRRSWAGRRASSTWRCRPVSGGSWCIPPPPGSNPVTTPATGASARCGGISPRNGRPIGSWS